MDDGRQRPWTAGVACPLPAGVFTPQEEWAWSRIVRGEIADMRFARYDAEDGLGADPTEADRWPPHRELSALFLKTILFHRPWSHAMEGARVHIAHARILGDLEWSGRTVRRELALTGCRIEGRFIAQRARFLGLLVLEGSYVSEPLKLDGARLSQDLLLRGMPHLGDVRLVGAALAQDLQLQRTVVTGGVDLSGARVGGELVLARGAEDGPRWGAGASLTLRNARAGALTGGVEAFAAKGGKRGFVALDLAGFAYQRLGGSGAGAAPDQATLAAAPVKRLLRLLSAACDPRKAFEPEPYAQLAQALETAGRPAAAARLRVAGGHHEFAARGVPLMRKLGLAVSWLLVGYGERTHRALLWFAALVFGTAWLGLAASGACPRGPDVWADWAGFALGNAAPVLTLDEAHKTFLADAFPAGVPLGLTGVFYTAKLIGFVVLSYFVAGLAGRARRRR